MVTRVVSNNSELVSALAASAAGDVIECTASANLGSLDYNSTDFAGGGGLVIRSQDPANPAFFTHLRFTGNAGNITLMDLLFDYTFVSGHAPEEAEFSTSSVSNITFDYCEFRGDNQGAPYFYQRGLGLQIYYGSHISVTNCKFDTWYRCIEVFNSHNFTLRKSELTKNSGDALKVTSSNTLVVRDNHFHDNAYPVFGGHDMGSADHIDAIQIQRNLGGCVGIQIIGNIFDYGRGAWGQGIGIFQDSFDISPGSQYRHSDVTISDNVFYNGHDNGISVTGIDNLTINNNSLFEGTTPNTTPSEHYDSNGNWKFQGVSQSPYPRVTVLNSTNVSVTKNISTGMNTFDPAWTDTDNYVITRADYGSDVTVHANGVTHTYHDYELVSGPAHTGLAGSRMMKRTGGWGGQEIAPHPSYQGGSGAVAPPTLPAGSVTATFTVP